jgi:SAM-dependent methyltransferase
MILFCTVLVTVSELRCTGPRRQVPFIRFGDLSTEELANAIVNHPIIIKPTLCLVNVASRAVERDLGFSLDTYVPKVSQRQADQLAGMIKPMLPAAMALPAVMELDRYFWTDKQMRAHKGTWERTITEAINKAASGTFRKRKFECNGEEFEIDAAFPATGSSIAVAVDVKRIESPRDIHKRADEIINKAAKFKKAYPKGTFVALVYYPFPTQHINVQSRVESPDIDAIFFFWRNSIVHCKRCGSARWANRSKKKVDVNLSFDEFPDFASVSRPLVSAKRTSEERGSIHAWHPYYAGYSEAFVRSALSYLGCGSDTLILDPFGGSGTSGLVASMNSVPALSIDVNPAMATFSAAKSPQVIDFETSISEFFDSIETLNLESFVPHERESLVRLFEPETASSLRAVVESIPFRPDALDQTCQIPEVVRFSVRDQSTLIGAAYAFCLAVVFVTLREYSGTRKGSNPTWLRRSGEKIGIANETLYRALRRNCTNMLADIREEFRYCERTVPSFSMSADVKSLPLRDATVDRVITSPPYLTRIDYAVSTSPELILLGDDELLRYVRHRSMGAPVITKEAKEQRENWGTRCNEVLNSIKSHDTKAAASYYWKNIVQYFMDTDAALKEIVRVLRPGGEGLIVVQSSYFKEIDLPLGEIYVDMARAKGLSAEIAYREPVKGHMAHVNTKSSAYKRDKVYFEDFVHIQKSKVDPQ